MEKIVTGLEQSLQRLNDVASLISDLRGYFTSGIQSPRVENS